MTDTTNLVVIGGGPGGYVAAIRAGQLGLDVTLVESDAVGGTCLNYGCIPSKALISATDIVDEARNAEEMGIHADVTVDTSALIDWKDGVVEQLTGGVEQLCGANGVEVVAGRAEFEDANTISVHGSGDTDRIEFEQAVISTGSRPIELPGFEFDDEPVLDSREALSLEDTPEELVIVGAGYIGMELATVFAKLETEVTVVEMLDKILPTYDSDLSEPVARRAKERGVTFRFGEGATGWQETDDGIVVTTEDEDGEAYEYAAEKVLVAVGREPVVDTVDLESADLQTDDDGFIPTDRQQRTEHDHIFAVGDVAGEPMLAHKASAEGIVAAEVAAGEETTFDHAAIPAAVFTEPEIATVGMSEQEAEESGFPVSVGEFPFQASGRALTTGHSDGFVRVIADADSEILLGAEIVGPEASELIAELGLAVEVGATLTDLSETIHTHPTLSEAVTEAAENAFGKAIHTVNR